MHLFDKGTSVNSLLLKTTGLGFGDIRRWPLTVVAVSVFLDGGILTQSPMVMLDQSSVHAANAEIDGSALDLCCSLLSPIRLWFTWHLSISSSVCLSVRNFVYKPLILRSSWKLRQSCICGLNFGSCLRLDPGIFWRILQRCETGNFCTVWLASRRRSYGIFVKIFSLFGQGSPH